MTYPIRSTLLALTLLASQAPAFAAAINEADKKFLTDDEQGARYELALAQMAQQKATRPEVKAYAARLVKDHETQNPALEKLVASQGVTPSVGMKDEDQTRLNELSNQAGPAFDGKFVDEAVRVNAKDKKAGDQEKSSTSDADIKAFLNQFASMDSEHEKAALALQQK